ncbi:MAG TPA: hypothetical protein VMS18_19720 [Candidatus Binatia bacterium]|nr:hypothetical protein [Candidatus Binatia bacterium]
MKPWLILVVVLASVAGCSAQASEPPAQQSVGETPAPPTMLGQDIPRGRPLEGAGPNYLTGGISITQMYTDNAELTNSNPVDDLSYEFLPHLALVHSAPRLTYDLDAMAGFVVNRTLSDRNRATQTGTADLSYRMTQFTALRLSDSFLNTTGLWSGLNSGTDTSGGGIGAVQQPNSSIFTYEQFRSNTALAELSAQLNANSFAGVRATHSYTWFPNGANSPLAGPLYDGQVYSAEAFYNRHLTARNWGGITIRAQRFDLDNSVGRTDTGSLLFLYGVNIRPNASLSLFAGPELSVTAVPQGIPLPPTPFQRRLWSPATGAVLSWQGHTTSTWASFNRQINSSGGLSSAVTLTSVGGNVLKQLGRNFAFGPGFVYSESVPITETQTIRTYSGLVQFTYYVGRNYQVNGGYARDEQRPVGTNNSASADRVWISFSLDFIRPLGR